MPRLLLFCLSATQALNSAAIPIGFIAGSLTSVALAGGNGRYAGAPGFISLTTAALATLFAGRLIAHWGYKSLLIAACLLGLFGFALAGFAAWKTSLPLFLFAFACSGPAFGLLALSRYAAAEASEPAFKARAIGLVMLGSTVGAIAGPWLATAGELAFQALAWPKVLGPWALAMGLYALAAINLLFNLRLPAMPAPMPQTARTPAASGGKSLAALLREPRIATAILAAIGGQVAMVFIMAITPLHMHQCHYAMTSISWVLSSHFVGMYALSFLSGWLADKIGRPESIALGSLILLASCLLAPKADSVPTLMLALFLLGWGWNLGFLGASATLVDGLDPAERGRIQGFNESLVQMASSLGSLSSGLAFASLGYGGMAAVGLGVSALPLLPWVYKRIATK